MRIAVMGAGSVGGNFGGMLSRGGNEVTLIARGSHLNAIASSGLKVITDEEEFIVRCNATDDPGRVGTVDLVLLTVKTYQNQEAIPGMLPLVGPNTSILCLQNGIDSYQAVVSAVGPQKVLPGATYIEASIEGPGVVRQTGAVVRIAFGEMDGSRSQRGNLIKEVLERSGIPAQFDRDIQKTLWTKFVFIAMMAGLTSLSRETMAQLMPRPEWQQLIIACMDEIAAVGRATGVNLDPAVVEQTLAYIESSLEEVHASMHSDIVAGHPLELEALTGAVVRAGKAAGAPTPINDVIYAMLKPYAMGGFDKSPTGA